MPLTVAKLARACGLSRTAVLYYESLGLLKPARRTQGNYRAYGERELQRLQQICFYRAAGLKLNDIRSILDGPRAGAAGVLKRRMENFGQEIERLGEHQRAIAQLLKQTNQLREIFRWSRKRSGFPSCVPAASPKATCAAGTPNSKRTRRPSTRSF